MINAAAFLKNMYLHLLHVSYVLRAFHRVDDTILNNYQAVDSLISNTKKI